MKPSSVAKAALGLLQQCAQAGVRTINALCSLHVVPYRIPVAAGGVHL